MGGVMQVAWMTVVSLCRALAERQGIPSAGVYGVPTGGSVVAGLLTGYCWAVPLLDAPRPGCLVVDDLVDSGATLQRYVDQGYAVEALIRKPHSPAYIASHAPVYDGWVQWPWEHSGGPTDAVTRLLEFIGEDPHRDGLRKTPERVVNALSEMTAGYQEDPIQILDTTFDIGTYDELVLVRGVRFSSLCEHHLLPFTGVASVGYIPGERVVGLSKLARLVLCFAKRLQVQERLTQQVADMLMRVVRARGAGCVIRATHQCMACRGVVQPDAEMVTSAMFGLLRDDQKARAEFFSLCDGVR